MLILNKIKKYIIATIKLFIVSPEIYVAATRSMGGPPAQLFNMYVGKRDTVGFVITPWIQNQIKEQLIVAGYDEPTAENQSKFIASLGYPAKDPSELGEDPIVSIAAHLNLDTVYHASGRDNNGGENIQFKPVHELISIITSI